MTTVLEHPETGAVAEERRTAPRHRVLKGATLSFNQGYGAFECLVRNLSANGARLSFGDASAVPPAFALTIKGESGRRAARVRWRSRTDLGVSFDC